MNRYLEMSPENVTKMQAGITMILESMSLEGEHFTETPERLSRALRELCAGVNVNIEEEVFGKGVFETDQKEIRMPTTFKNISARGMCPHHLLPIIYTVDIEYKPRKNVVGLSRVHRLVRVLAARPVLQEQLAYDIAVILRDKLECAVKVRLEGLHMCMVARGAKTELNSPVITELELT